MPAKIEAILATVVEQSASVSRARIIGAMTGMLAPGDAAATIEALATDQFGQGRRARTDRALCAGGIRRSGAEPERRHPGL